MRQQKSLQNLLQRKTALRVRALAKTPTVTRRQQTVTFLWLLDLAALQAMQTTTDTGLLVRGQNVDTEGDYFVKAWNGRSVAQNAFQELAALEANKSRHPLDPRHPVGDRKQSQHCTTLHLQFLIAKLWHRRQRKREGRTWTSECG